MHHSRVICDREGARAGVRAMTLTELIVVLVILAGVAGLAISAVGFVAADSREQVTRASMVALRNAIDSKYKLNLGGPPRYAADLLRRRDALPVFDPFTQVGWNGPYVLVPGGTYLVAQGVPGDPDYVHESFTDWYCDDGPEDPEPDPAVLDGYGRPLVIQYPDPDDNPLTLTADDIRHARIVSAGSNGAIDTPFKPPFEAGVDPEERAWFPPRALCGDDLVLYMSVADLRPE